MQTVVSLLSSFEFHQCLFEILKVFLFQVHAQLKNLVLLSRFYEALFCSFRHFGSEMVI